MRVLAHYIQKEVSSLIERLNYLHILYVQKSFDMEKELLLFLEDTKDFYKLIGLSNDELRTGELISCVHTALNGFNPRTLEKLRIGKRDNFTVTCFYCLNEVGSILKKSLDQVKHELAEATEVIKNILLSVLQTAGLAAEELFQYDTVEKCEVLWNRLIADVQIDLFDKKLKTTITEKDIFLLLDATILKMQG